MQNIANLLTRQDYFMLLIQLMKFEKAIKYRIIDLKFLAEFIIISSHEF